MRICVPGNWRPGLDSQGMAKACEANCGVAFEAFLREVRANRNVMNDAVQRRINTFMNAAQIPNDAWERRFAQRFALAFAAGAIAGEFGIVPWDKKTIGLAVKSCYLAARATVPDADQLRSDGFVLLRAHLRNKELILDLMRSGHKVYWTRGRHKRPGTVGRHC
jgi:hypothetical protein